MAVGYGFITLANIYDISIDVQYLQTDTDYTPSQVAQKKYSDDNSVKDMWVANLQADKITSKYVWQRTKTYARNIATQYSIPTLIVGNSGEDGKDGKGIKKIEEQYYLSDSDTELVNGANALILVDSSGNIVIDSSQVAVGTTKVAGSGWEIAPPEYEKGKYYWTRSKITWSDDTITYTDPVVSRDVNKANQKAEEAKDAADDAKETAQKAIDFQNNYFYWSQAKGLNIVPAPVSTDTALDAVTSAYAQLLSGKLNINAGGKTVASFGMDASTNQPISIIGDSTAFHTETKPDGVYIMNGATQLAKYGDTLTLGVNNAPQLVMDSTGISLKPVGSSAIPALKMDEGGNLTLGDPMGQRISFNQQDGESFELNIGSDTGDHLKFLDGELNISASGDISIQNAAGYGFTLNDDGLSIKTTNLTLGDGSSEVATQADISSAIANLNIQADDSWKQVLTWNSEDGLTIQTDTNPDDHYINMSGTQTVINYTDSTNGSTSIAVTGGYIILNCSTQLLITAPLTDRGNLNIGKGSGITAWYGEPNQPNSISHNGSGNLATVAYVLAVADYAIRKATDGAKTLDNSSSSSGGSSGGSTGVVVSNNYLECYLGAVTLSNGKNYTQVHITYKGATFVFQSTSLARAIMRGYTVTKEGAFVRLSSFRAAHRRGSYDGKDYDLFKIDGGPDLPSVALFSALVKTNGKGKYGDFPDVSSYTDVSKTASINGSNLVYNGIEYQGAGAYT